MNAKFHLFASSAAASLLMAASPVLAQQAQQCPSGNPPAAKRPPAQCFEQGYELSREKFPAAYNAPARIDVHNSWDIFLSASFIYWFVGQDGMNLAWPTAMNGAGVFMNPHGSVLMADTKYHPGFKVALGADFDFDNWVGYLEYTWLHGKTSTGTKTPPDDSRGTPVWNVADWLAAPSFDNLATTIKASWKVRLDMLDAAMSRPFYQGRRLTIAPVGGLRGLWLRQSLKVSTTAPSIFTTTAPNPASKNSVKSWAVGPFGGMQGHWLLGSGMRFEGDFGASLLYTRYTKVKSSHDPAINNLFSPTAPPDPFSLKFKTTSALRPMLTMGVGLGWGTYFCKQDYHVDLSATYDFLLFWGQNMMQQLLLSSRGLAAAPGDLYMHGLTANLRWDF